MAALHESSAPRSLTANYHFLLLLLDLQACRSRPVQSTLPRIRLIFPHNQHIYFSTFLINYYTKMDAAIEAIKRGECIRVAEAARNYSVDPTTLRRRMNSTQLSQADYAETRSILNRYEDSALLEWINDLSA